MTTSKKRTFADEFKRIEAKYKDAKDPIALKSKDLEIQDLIEKQEQARAAQQEQLEMDEMKKGGWIQKAVNPKHKGYCTPMTKSTCTPHRKALARRFKSGEFKKHQQGGSLPSISNILVK